MKINLNEFKHIGTVGTTEAKELPNGNYIEQFVNVGEFYFAKYKSKYSDVNVAKDSLIATSKLKKIIARAEVSDLIDDNATMIKIDDVNYSIVATEDVELTNQTINEYILLTLEKVEQSK